MQLPDFWHVMGNACAGLAVGKTLYNIPLPIGKLSDDVQSWNSSDKVWLKKVCRFYLAVVRRRFDLAKLLEYIERRQQDGVVRESRCLMPPNLFGADAYDCLSDLGVQEYQVLAIYSGPTIA